ncbi:MAG: hypothetical protein PSV35_07470, partial [bacterium]|nr:hypothetical protein [bacterium]
MLTAEENKVLLTKMRAVLKNAPPNALINEFLGLIDSNQHQTALLWGCKACRPGETALLSMLAILLWHMEHIELNLDKKDEDSISAIQHCVTNQNFDLLKLLIGWGASTVEVNADHKQDLYSRITTPTITKIKSSLNPHFHKLSKHLEATFLSSSLPDKNDIDTDRENEIYDSNRLIFINRTINFIHSHLKEDAPSAIITFEPNDIEAMELRNFKRSLLKLSLFRIAKTIANLSGSLRSYYGKCFHPVPFTWTTLEQLCFFELLYAGTVNSVIVVPTQEWFRDPESHAIGANFLKKGWDILYLTERFIPHILNDLTILEHLFNTMLHQIGRNERTPIEPIELPNIKAAISYIDNNRSLAQLLKLTTFQNQVVTPE